MALFSSAIVANASDRFSLQASAASPLPMAFFVLDALTAFDPRARLDAGTKSVGEGDEICGVNGDGRLSLSERLIPLELLLFPFEDPTISAV